MDGSAAATGSTHTGGPSPRVHYVDWLRVLAVLLLFPFHVSRVFNFEPFYVKSVVEYAWLNPVLWFVSTWHMPLLFFLAGASSAFALRKRNVRQYASERVHRLLLPLALGLLLVIPPQTWVGARTNSGYANGFVSYMLNGDFLAWNIQDGGDYFGGFGIGHLWFLLWLFAVSMMALPLMAWGRRRGSQSLETLTRRLAHPAWWLGASFLVFVGEALPDVLGLNPFYFLTAFLLGFASVGSAEFARSAQRHRWWVLPVATVLCGFWVISGGWRDSLPDPSFARAGASYLGAAGTWLAIVAAVGFASHHLDRASRPLAYLAPASYPLYILHQTVIVVLAWWMARLPMPAVAQWVILLTGSVAITFAAYEALRRVPYARVVIGVRAPSAPRPPRSA